MRSPKLLHQVGLELGTFIRKKEEDGVLLEVWVISKIAVSGNLGKFSKVSFEQFILKIRALICNML